MDRKATDSRVPNDADDIGARSDREQATEFAAANAKRSSNCDDGSDDDDSVFNPPPQITPPAGTEDSTDSFEGDVSPSITRARKKIRDLRTEIGFQATDLRYIENIKKAIAVLEKIEPLWIGFKETSFSDNIQKVSVYLDLSETADSLFEIAEDIEEKTAEITTYEESAAKYGSKSSLLRDSITATKRSAEQIINYSLRYSELVTTAPQAAEYLLKAIASFSEAKEAHELATASIMKKIRRIRKERNKKPNGSKVQDYPNFNIAETLTQAASHHTAAAQKAVAAAEWLQEKRPLLVNDPVIRENNALYDLHKKIAENFLNEAESTKKMEKYGPKESLFEIQFQLANAFHDLAVYHENHLVTPPPQTQSTTESIHASISLPDVPPLSHPEEESFLNHIQELKNQESVLQEKAIQSSSRRCCIIM